MFVEKIMLIQDIRIKVLKLCILLDYHICQVTSAFDNLIIGNFWRCYYGGTLYEYNTVPGMFYSQECPDVESIWVGSRY